MTPGSTLLTEANRKWWTLASVAVGLFMIMLDTTVVNVALPSIQRDLGIGVTELEWIVTGYMLSFAVLQLTGGKLGDMYGRRRMFMLGLAIFTASSLLCGLAGSAEVLIGARVAQGVGGALMMPATLSIITATFPLSERGAALGIWSGVSAVALAFGPLVGGLITEQVGWNWVFYINVPVGILGLVAARLLITESKDTSHEQRLDVPGLLSSGVAVFALVFALIEANSYGWTSSRILGLFALAVVAGAAFVLLELRQRVPMLDLTLFRNPTFAGSNAVGMIVTFTTVGFLFYLSLYMQNVLGYSAVRAGLGFAPWMLAVIVVAPRAGKASDRLGSRWLASGGLALITIGLLFFARIDSHSSYWSLFPGMLTVGVGMATVVTPNIAAALSAVPVDKAGVGSGVLNTVRQVGGSLGIAAIGAILASTSTSSIADGATEADAFVDGLHDALYASAVLTTLGAIVAVVTIRSHPGVRPGRAVARVG